MQFIKSILALVLVVTVAAGGVYAATNRGLLPGGKFAKAISVIHWIKQAPFGNVATVTQSSNQGIQVLSSAAEQTASQAGAVLGTHISVDEDRTPLHQKAFEYARYTYCQEVVVDYQARHGENSK